MMVEPGIIGEGEAGTARREADEARVADVTPAPAIEIGGRGGPDPTRYGDWEKNGRCIDF